MFDEEGNYQIKNIIEAQNLMDVLDDLDYDISIIDKSLKNKIEKSSLISKEEKRELLGKLYLFLSENSYLKTIQAQNNEG
jgi:arginine decarboxylase